jgi:hypothetical protein
MVRWEYSYEPEPNSVEASLYDTFLKPQDWLNNPDFAGQSAPITAST